MKPGCEADRYPCSGPLFCFSLRGSGDVTWPRATLTLKLAVSVQINLQRPFNYVIGLHRVQFYQPTPAILENILGPSDLNTAWSMFAPLSVDLQTYTSYSLIYMTNTN